jgi:RNase P subunit RPR2
MALFYEEENKRIKCPKCNSFYLYEKNINSYLKEKERYESIPYKILLICNECETVVQDIKPNTPILSIK